MMMMMMGMKMDFVGYGYCFSCNCNASSERLFAKTTNCVKRALIRTSRKTRVYFTKTPESLFNVNGVGVSQSSLPILEVKKDESNPVSLASIFQVVADDLLTLNNNLQTIVGAENPVLMSAAEQIFGAGGKRMRPALVFLVSRATAELAGLKYITFSDLFCPYFPLSYRRPEGIPTAGNLRQNIGAWQKSLR